MLHFLGILFVIIIAVLFIGLSIIGAILRGLFGMGRRKSASSDSDTHSSGGNRQYHTSDSGDGIQPEEGELHINRKKIFTKDDGEYVDFEEVKE